MKKKVLSLITASILTLSIMALAPAAALNAATLGGGGGAKTPTVASTRDLTAIVLGDVVPDLALNNAIRNDLNTDTVGDYYGTPLNTANDILPTDVLDANKMLGLTIMWVHGDDKGIVSLEGLQYATNATQLDLPRNQISDLTPLAGLTNLTHLDLRENQISDLTPLAGLTNLNFLYLGYNLITDITPLAGLTTNLISLDLDYSQISDFTLLADFTSLVELRLTGTKISDLTILAGLSNLLYLYLALNDITDITPLSTLTTLVALDLRYNDIETIAPLSTLTNLEYLTMRNSNHIIDISPLIAVKDTADIYLDGQIATLPAATNNGNTVTITNPIKNVDGTYVNLNAAGNVISHGGTYNATANTITWNVAPGTSGNFIISFTADVVGIGGISGEFRFSGGVVVPYGIFVPTPLPSTSSTSSTSSVSIASSTSPGTGVIPGGVSSTSSSSTSSTSTSSTSTSSTSTTSSGTSTVSTTDVTNPKTGHGLPIAVVLIVGTTLTASLIVLKKNKV